MVRLYAAFEQIARATNPKARVGQSALARRLGQSPQTVKNWEVRGISQRGATTAQDRLGVNATWILNGTGATLAGEAGLPTPSQTVTPDPDILHEALVLIDFDQSLAGPYPPRAYARRLADLYARVAADGGRLSTARTLEFEREVEARQHGGSNVPSQAGRRSTADRQR